ncbi:MAG: hypothetical protein ACU837_16650 [Gammaproteobacteria bacterium]
MNNKKNWLTLGPAALLVAAFIAACATTEDQPQTEETAVEASAVAGEENTAATAPESPEDAVSQPQEKPGRIEGGFSVTAAKVKDIDKKNRVVTLIYPDGREEEIKCGPEVRNFTRIRKGDLVMATFLEIIELYVSGETIPSAERSTALARAPLGAKPAFAVIDSAQLSVSVEDIDYPSRELTLKNPDGNLVTMTVGPEVKRLHEIKKGDTVDVRLVRAISIEVSKPEKKKN